jgi:long-chain acyl-CoA synthetase
MIWNFNQFKDKTALISDTGKILSYCQLLEAMVLINKKLLDRSLIICLCNNTIGSVVGYLSFLNNNHVPIILDFETNLKYIEDQIIKWKPAFLWLPKEKKHLFPFPTVIIYEDFCLLKVTDIIGTLHQDLALLLSTSGSTGNTKLVRISYSNIVSNTKSIINYLKIDSTERAITLLPMHYSYGLSILNTHLYAGGSIVLTQKSSITKEFWQLIESYKITSISGVPFIYNFLNRLDLSKTNLSSVKVFTQAGGKLSSKLQKEFAQKCIDNNCKFFVMYGQTEATARISYLPSEKTKQKIGSIGIPVPNGRIEIWDENQIIITKENQVGELVYFGNNVCMGYANNTEELLLGDEYKGSLKTGDLGYFDTEGYYYITGRKNRIAKVFGTRVNLDELESLVQLHFQNIEFACVEGEETIKLFIVKNTLLEELKKFLFTATKLSHRGFEFIEVNDIFRNKSGKIMYDLLKTKYD